MPTRRLARCARSLSTLLTPPDWRRRLLLARHQGVCGLADRRRGGRYAILLGQGDKPIDAVVANHPSFATDDEIANVTVPTQINVGDADAMMSVDQVRRIRSIRH